MTKKSVSVNTLLHFHRVRQLAWSPGVHLEAGRSGGVIRRGERGPASMEGSTLYLFMYELVCVCVCVCVTVCVTVCVCVCVYYILALIFNYRMYTV